MVRSPRAVPWEITLPWALLTLIPKALVVPVRDDRVRGFACAKAADGSTGRGVGTSVTARMPNACVRCGAGRRQSGRPSGAWMKRSKSSTPSPSGRDVSVAHLRRNHPSLSKLRQRVVTQQKFFANFLCARPGCYESPWKSPGKPACFCCPACCQAVRRVLDRERKWQFRGTFQGRCQRAREYEAARVRRCGQQHHTASATSARPPPS